MATRTVYGLGGFDASKPAGNKVEQWDGVAGTYTRWNAAGAQVEQRALTSDEAVAFAAQDAQVTADANGAILRQQSASALAGNRTYLAVVTPTSAQTAAQVKALTRQMNTLVRLTLGQLDGTD